MKQMQTIFLIALSLLAVLAGGCAGQRDPTQGGLAAEQPQTLAYQGAKIHTELAGEYYARGQMGVAIEELAEALRSDPNYAPAYNVLGLVYMELREDVLAQQNFERALRISPNDSDIHNNYGWFLCQRKRDQTDQAVQHFMAALKNPLYTTPEKSYTNAGLCSQNSGDSKSAEAFFQKALLIKPSYSQALLGLTEIYFKNGDLTAARANISRYMQVSTPTAESLWLGIRIERKVGDHNVEASYTLQLKKRFPNSKEAVALRDGKFE